MSPSKLKKCFTSVNKSENKCNICFQIVKGTNTTNMKKHLMLKHPSKLAVLAQEQHPMVIGNGKSVSTFQYIIK